MARIRNALHKEIIPGILEGSWEEIEKKIHLVTPFAETIHIDVIDGIFAPTTTFLDPSPFQKYTATTRFEVHLMVDNPQSYLEQFAKAGFSRFIGHIERMEDIPGFVAKAQDLGEVGLALDVATPVASIAPYREDIDVAFVMTHKAGASRLEFDPTMLEKVGELRSLDDLLPIEVDGGVDDSTISAAEDAGATRFVTTGFIFDGENIEDQYKKLKEILH